MRSLRVGVHLYRPKLLGKKALVSTFKYARDWLALMEPSHSMREKQQAETDRNHADKNRSEMLIANT